MMMMINENHNKDDDDYDDSYLSTFELINQCISYDKISNNEIEDYLKGQISNCTCSSTVDSNNNNGSSRSNAHSNHSSSSGGRSSSSSRSSSCSGSSSNSNDNGSNDRSSSGSSSDDNKYKICYDHKCINYSTQTECITCHDEYCYNQRFKKKKYANLYVKHTIRKGYGLFTHEDLKKNQFLMEYVGK